MRLQLFILAAASLTALGQARANPISVDVLRCRQMPGSLDVQVTHGVDSSAAPSGATIKSITRDGKALTGKWYAGSYTGNTGSGLVSLGANQLCDCALAEGQHSYSVTVEVKGMGKAHNLTCKVTVAKNPASLDAGGGGKIKDGGAYKDMAPWEIPEPGAVQGVDCAKICKGGVPVSDVGPAGKDMGLAADKGPAVTPDAGKVSGEKEDDGCAVAGAGAQAPALLLLALAALALRRRRS